MKIIGLVAVGAISLFAAQQAQAASCEDITIADMSSMSAEFLAAMDKFILNKGFGCNANLVAGDTVPAITAMIEKGQPDIIPEGAVDVVPALYKEGVETGKIVAVSDPLSDAGNQGLWIPKYMVDKDPQLATLAGVLKNPELFANPENPSRGGIYNGAPGWGATIVTAQLYKANKMADYKFDLIDPGSLAGLDSAISRAYERKQGIIAYYWSPTGLLGRYDMVKVDLGVANDPEEWKRCTAVAECADPKPNAWTASDNIKTLVSKKFSEAGGDAIDYLKKRELKADTINKVLAWMNENQAKGEDAAQYFLTENPDIWTKWVSPDVAEKVKSAL
ncbi:glycine betaine ABC transporter substrate-binding protein [Rhizobium metallidurans]|uniref:Glycine betaine/proline transport system substrate-binding protein n=1 Tax=Rhizobium metallidurans TaxID=1265931 RepID=A0A7W6CSQ1_9HYPH|nr:glycine betaine ABC transporter substrate-binding protein [Rhizobium metallidurans]MBB3962975.1 glycine betaine/proline transport system substrate-binding protein [Rhizobium metallidurans]